MEWEKIKGKRSEKKATQTLSLLPQVPFHFENLVGSVKEEEERAREGVRGVLTFLSAFPVRGNPQKKKKGKEGKWRRERLERLKRAETLK